MTKIHVEYGYGLSEKNEWIQFDTITALKISKTISLSIKMFTHKDMDLYFLNQIITIKTLSGPFSYESQIKWFENNFSESDLHYLLFDKEILIGYLSLTKIEAEIDIKKVNNIWGIGSVCTFETGKGYGNLLMQTTNEWLKVNDQIGMLLCKDRVKDFYLKNNWILFDKIDIRIERLINNETNILFFNISHIDVFSYNGKLF